MYAILALLGIALAGLVCLVAYVAGVLLHASWRRRGKTLLPARRYDDSRCERSLWNPVPVPLDSELAGIARRYAASDAAGRARMRDLVNDEYYYELLTFAERAAVFALRERGTEYVRDGLAAIAMIEPARNHPYDTSVSGQVALLYHASLRIGADAAALLREAAALADERVARILDGFPDRPPGEIDLRASWLLEEVQTPGGPGFIRRGIHDYQPTLDLVSAGVEMLDVLARDEYRPCSLRIAEDLPSMWLRTGGSPDPGAVSRALHTVRAVAMVDTHLRPEVHRRHDAQSLLVFLLELANEQDARTLQDASRQVRHPGAALLGMAEGRLFCLVVARSYVHFVKSYETTERIARFHAPLSAILSRYAAGPAAGTART
jgi:hypothetical protein